MTPTTARVIYPEYHIRSPQAICSNSLVQVIVRTPRGHLPNASFNVDQTFDVGIARWAKVEQIRGIAAMKKMA